MKNPTSTAWNAFLSASMIYLLAASIIWGFSFGLIKTQLSGLDSSWVAWVRLLLSTLCFLPFLKVKHVSRALILQLLCIGGVQYGLMYLSYLYAFRYLPAHQVALFTITTPIFVAITNDLSERRLHADYVLAALLSVGAAGLLVYKSGAPSPLALGFVLLQISNLCFAIGQLAYKKVLRNRPQSDSSIFAWLYLGGFLLVSLAVALGQGFVPTSVTATQLSVLAYLGLVASGIAFFLWNVGARKCETGTLAVLNNAKVPLGVLISLTIFDSQLDSGKLLKLICAMLLMSLATIWAEYRAKRRILLEKTSVSLKVDPQGTDT